MARDPGSVWRPLAEAGSPDGYVKTQFIVHSTGDNGTASATYRYFSGPTPNESTFIVGQGPHDPTIQLMDSTDRADANMSASIRAISVEVVGDGVGGYNAWQRSEIIRLALWARETHPGILPRIIPSHTEPGFGWHVMFGAPGPWAGVAKSCPGKQRIKELKNDIFPAIFAGDPTSEEDDMFDDGDRKLLVRAVSALEEAQGSTGRNNFAWLADQVLPPLADIRAAVLGNNEPGRNNFHWLAEQLAAVIPGAEVHVVEQAIAKAVADEIDRRERERLADDPAA